jgi:hypothetical protein
MRVRVPAPPGRRGRFEPASERSPSSWSGVACGFRTCVSGLKVRRPRPLDERDMAGALGDASNARPAAYKAAALPAELQGQEIHFGCVHARASRRTRCLAARGLARVAHIPAANTMSRGSGVHGHTRSGADDEIRTRGLDHGVVALFQLSYIRKCKTTVGQYRGRLAAGC